MGRHARLIPQEEEEEDGEACSADPAGGGGGIPQEEGEEEACSARRLRRSGAIRGERPRTRRRSLRWSGASGCPPLPPPCRQEDAGGPQRDYPHRAVLGGPPSSSLHLRFPYSRIPASIEINKAGGREVTGATRAGAVGGGSVLQRPDAMCGCGGKGALLHDMTTA